MPQTSAINLIAVSLLLSMSVPVHAQSVQYAQAQQSQTQLEQDYQNRLRAAKTPEERARIQAEHDRMMQQGALPGGVVPGSNVTSGPGTAQDSSPGGGGSVPRGQSGGDGGGNGDGGSSNSR